MPRVTNTNITVDQAVHYYIHVVEEVDVKPYNSIYASAKITIIGSDNDLSPDRRQAIIWTNTGILLIGPLRTNVSEALIEIHTFSFREMHLKMSYGKWRPFCLGLNVLKYDGIRSDYTEVVTVIYRIKNPEWYSVYAAMMDNYMMDN